MNKLAPCPVCGGEMQLLAWTTPDDMQYYAACSGCGLKTDDFPLEGDLVSYWNAHMSLWQRTKTVMNSVVAWLTQKSDCTTKELAPCPYCGSINVGDAGLWRHVIKCHDCGAHSKPCAKWDEAVDAWNSRTLSPEQVYADELFEALDYVLTQLRLAVMGFGHINIDAVKLQELYDTVTGKYGVVDDMD